MAKVSFTVLAITPLAKTEAVQAVLLTAGIVARSVLALVGYIFDGMEVKP